MDPENGQFVNEKLKKTGKYHPGSTRAVNQNGRTQAQFAFNNMEEQSMVSEAFTIEAEPHLPSTLSVEQSISRVTDARMIVGEARSQIEIGDTEMQQRLDGHSEVYS